MLARSTRSKPTRALPALVLSVALAAGLLTACSKDDDASKPAPDGPPASQRAGVPLDVSVGDPVRIADDGPATITASVAVRGQADTVADLSAIGRALLTQPRLVLLDEPSMGLAPKIVQEIFQIIVRLNREKGVAFLLAEQNAALSLVHASRAYILESGRVALEGRAGELAARDDLHHIYLGGGS